MKTEKIIKNYFLMLIMIFSFGGIMAQNVVTGNVTDGENGDALIGANIIVKNTTVGTITDLDGNYSLVVTQDLPYTISISLIGYETVEIEVNSASAVKNMVLNVQSIMADEIVVSASRVEEKILESPVTIEKLDLIAIKQSASADYYDELTKLKGVHTNQASMTFNTLNTRGFATAGNTRFVQLMDGMDNAAPLLNFPTGNVVGISELDISNVELVPGAASALYGPNAFNGILMMNSKNPFKYQGLSASIKGGLAMGDGYNNPLMSASVRWADAVNDKLAYKFNVSFMQAQDWKANNYTESIDIFNPSAKPGDSSFDGVNVYGDETAIPLGPLGTIRRTGFNEGDLLESNDAKSIKLSGALHYKFSNDLEANISYRHGIGSSVYQGSERYALRDFTQSFTKAELNGKNWNIRSYLSQTNAGDSYNLTALGAYTNEDLFQTLGKDADGNTIQSWALAYAGAVLGSYSNWDIPLDIADYTNMTGSHANAREFADAGGIASLSTDIQNQIKNDLIAKGYSEAQAIGTMNLLSGKPRSDYKASAEKVRSGLFQKGGASFIDNSRLYHTEANYNFSDMINNVMTLQVGGNLRRQSLSTDGTVFNEAENEDGTFERINVDEFGVYVQGAKSILNEKLRLGASLRYDKNENFDGNITPRVSAVYSVDEKKRHNIRASFQTGFRNPTNQGQYIYFPTTDILLGGTRANAEQYGIMEGGAYNAESYNNFLSLGGSLEADGTIVGDASLLQSIDVDYVKPEKLQAYEVGYKGLFSGKLMIDANVYYNIYTDFIDQISIVGKKATEHRGEVVPAGQAWRPYTNSPAEITSLGTGIGVKYKLDSKWSISGSADYATFELDKASLAGTGWEDYQPGFNTPEMKLNVGVTNRRIVKNLGFGINYRWQDSYYYVSSFGEGVVPSYGTLDAQVSYKLKNLHSTIKVGGSNLIGTPYITNIGNPEIGRLVFVSVTYDQFGN